jgi:hypothetical protein
MLHEGEFKSKFAVGFSTPLRGLVAPVAKRNNAQRKCNMYRFFIMSSLLL